MAARLLRISLIGVALAIMPTAAFAHSGDGSAGFIHGMVHPMSGQDHILAMLLVGMLAFRQGGRALWLVPGSFMLVMALGGALGAPGIPVPSVELGIALSVVVLGLVVALGINAPVAAAMGLVGLFAIFHGHAHGVEMPVQATGLAYGAGFLIATALLHAGGILAGSLIGRLSSRYGAMASRTAGGLAAMAGVGLLTGVL